MITLLVILFLLMIVFGIGFAITGVLLHALVWVCIRLPLAIILFALGIVFCCTIILIPVGISLLGMGAKMLLP